MTPLSVIVACEKSGNVRRAFRALGHDAWSNDLEEATDGSEYHLRGDALQAIASRRWDLMIAHPPCTYLSSSGLHWNTRGRMVNGVPRAQLTDEAIAFVRALMDSGVERYGIENPIGCISTRIRKPEQIIQPYDFGENASKGTCLWLKSLPPLRPTKYVAPRYVCRCGHSFGQELGKYGCPNCCGENGTALPRWANQTDSGQNRLGPSPTRGSDRAVTYPGIAAAMAEQWGSA